MRRALRHTVLALAAACALGASAPARADPVTIVVLAANVAGATGFLGMTAAMAAYVAFGVSIVGGIAARRKAKRAAASARDARVASMTDRCVTLMTSEPEPNVIYGRCPVGGWVIDKITTAKTYVDDAGAVRTKPDAYQHLVIGIACHEVEAIHDVFMYGDWVGTIGADGWVTGGPADAPYGKTHTIQTSLVLPFAGGAATIPQPQQGYSVSRLIAISQDQQSGDGALSHTGATLSGLSITGGPASGSWTVTVEISRITSSVRIEFFKGSPDQTASAYLMSVAPGVWTAAHRLRGIAGAVITFDLDDGRHQGIPSDLAFDVSGRKVLDPRTGQTIHSRNAALCIYDWMRAPWGLRLTTDDIADVSAVANICDQQISMTVGGVTTTGPRYTIDGAFGVNADKSAVLADMLETMGGFASHGAQWSIHAGAWTAPVMDLTDDDLAAPIRVVRSHTPLDERMNAAKASYMPERKTKPADADPYINGAFVAADGGREWGSFTLPFTNNKARARNLLRQFVEQSRAGMIIQYTGKMRLWPLQVGDRVTVTSSRFGLAADTFRVIDWSWSPGQPVVLTLQRDIAASYDDADASTADPAPATRLPNPGLVDTPSGLAAASGTAHLLKMADGTIVPRVLVTWTAPQTIYMSDPSARTRVAWRRASESTWSYLPQLPGNSTSAYLDAVRDRDVIIIRVQHVNSFGAASQWVSIAHAVVGKTAAPAGVVSLSVTEGQNGSRRYEWVHSPEVDHYGYELRYSPISTATWAQMLALGRAVGDVAGVEFSDPPDGSWRFAVCSIDTSGNYADVPAYADATLSGYGVLMASGSLSGNLLSNTEFGSKVTAPWTHGGAAALAFFGTESQRDQAQAFAPLGSDAICMQQVGAIAGGDTAAARDLVSEFVPVAPGVRYEFSAYVAAHRCHVQAYLEFFTPTLVGIAPAPMWSGAVDQGGQQLAQFTRVSVFGVAPAGAAYCRPILRKLNTWSGQPDSYCWMLKPYLGVASASQSMPAGYSPGVPRTVAQLGYTGDLNATWGAPIGSMVAGRLAQSIVSDLDAVVRDDIVSRPEKTGEIIRFNGLAGERAGLVSSAASLGISAQLGSYTAAFDALKSHLDGLPQFWDTNYDTQIVAATYRSKWDALLVARSALRTQIGVVSSQRATGMPLSGNLLSNTAFGGKSTAPWTHGGAAALAFFGTESQRDQAQAFAPLGSDAICMQQVGAIAGGDTAAARDLVSEFVPVAPGVRYEFSAYVAAHRCHVQAYLEFFTSTMAPISAVMWAGPASIGGQELAKFTRAFVFGIAPAGAAYCRPILRKLNTWSGQPDSYCWMLKPYLGVAGSDQESPSEYTPGIPVSHSNLGSIVSGDISTDAVLREHISQGAVGTTEIAGEAVSKTFTLTARAVTASQTSRSMAQISVALSSGYYATPPSPYYLPGSVIRLRVMLTARVVSAGSDGLVGIQISPAFGSAGISIMGAPQSLPGQLVSQVVVSNPAGSTFTHQVDAIVTLGPGVSWSISVSGAYYGSGFVFDEISLVADVSQSLR